MGLERLARELEETARQSAVMAEGVAAGLASLSDPSLDTGTARARAAAQIIEALQMQDRIDQRCRGLAQIARALADTGDAGRCETAWQALALEELREQDPAPASRARAGEVEFF